MFVVRSLLLLASLGLVLLLGPAPAPAQPIEGLEITTDELFEDKREARIIARGNVEIRFFGEILLADRIIYDRKLNRLWAEGNLKLQEADGKVIRANAMSLDDALRDAFIRYARREKVLIDR
jgi:lipopolysaccharide assembly outer membrane protein LptD (OstA)